MFCSLRLVLVFLTVCFGLHSHSQILNSILERDSLRITYRSGGELDSVDLYLFPNLTTLPGGYPGFQFNLPNNLFHSYANGRFDGVDLPFSKMKFSALPHIGFAYTFGSKGTQGVKARYEQYYGKHTLLNVRFDQLRSASFMRNGQYAINEVGLMLNHTRNRFILQLNADYKNALKSQNGGLENDSLVDQFSLEFLNTNKTSAESTSKKMNVLLLSMIDFTKDSLISSGCFVENALTVKNFRYKEGGELATIYSVINYDSLETADHFQQSSLSNGVGYYHLGKVNQFKAGLHGDYWKVFNLSRVFDTTEVRVSGEWRTKVKKTAATIYYENKFIGANNGQMGKAEINTTISNRVKLTVNAHYADQLPDPFLRYYLGNTIVPINEWKNEKRWTAAATIEVDIHSSTKLFLNYTNQFLKDNYFLINDSWSNSAFSRVQLNQIKAGFSSRFSSFSFRSNYTFSQLSTADLPFPKHRFDTRFLVSGFLFKAKKLKAYAGIDFHLQSSFRLASYIPMIDAFSLSDQNALATNMINLHAFAGFQIDQFRFFFRTENIGYFWSDRSNQLAVGYPIMPFQFRIGITWDFFN